MATLLLIEPDMLTARNARRYLEASGYEVHWQADAQAALDSAEAALPDLVILELQLSTHSGMEFLYEFRSYPMWQHIPIVIYSNIEPHHSPNRVAIWRELEISNHLYKPRTTLAALEAAVSYGLQAAHA